MAWTKMKRHSSRCSRNASSADCRSHLTLCCARHCADGTCHMIPIAWRQTRKGSPAHHLGVRAHIAIIRRTLSASY